MGLSENGTGGEESPEPKRVIDLGSIFNFGKRLLASIGFVSAKDKPAEYGPPCVSLNERVPGTVPCYYFYLANPFSHPTYFCVHASTQEDANRLALEYFKDLAVTGKVSTRQICPIDETPAEHMRAARGDARWR